MHGEERVDRPSPGELLGPGPGTAAQRCGRLREHVLDRPRQGRRVGRRGGARVAGDDLGQRRGARGDHRRAAGEGFQRREPERLDRAWGQDHVGAGEQRRDGRAVVQVPEEGHRQVFGPAFERGPGRAGPRDDELGVRAPGEQHAQGVHRQVRALLRRQPRAQHQPGRRAPRHGVVRYLAGPGRGQGVEADEVDPQWHHLRLDAQPFELPPGEPGGHHHVVERRQGAPVVPVGHGACRRRRDVQRPQHTVEPLVQQHQARHARGSGPGTRVTQREPVGDLDRVHLQGVERRPDGAGVHHGPVAGRAGHARRGQGHQDSPVLPGAPSPVGRHHQHELVTAVLVAPAQRVGERAHTTRVRGVCVGQVCDPHPVTARTLVAAR